MKGFTLLCIALCVAALASAATPQAAQKKCAGDTRGDSKSNHDATVSRGLEGRGRGSRACVRACLGGRDGTARPRNAVSVGTALRAPF